MECQLPDWLFAAPVPQERVLRHTVEQSVVCAQVVQIIDLPVPQMGGHEVGDVLGPRLAGVWEPVSPQGRVQSGTVEQAAGVHRDLARLERVW